MSEEEIIKLVRFLIGGISPVAESRYDADARNNANKSYEIISHLIADIGTMAADNISSCFGSCFDCAKNGVHILEQLKSEIETYLYEAGAEE